MESFVNEVTLFVLIGLVLALAAVLIVVLSRGRKRASREKERTSLEIHLAYSNGYENGGKELVGRALEGMNRGTVDVPERAAQRLRDEGWQAAEHAFKDRLEVLTLQGKITWNDEEERG